jgi:hypothetical protein
MSFRLDAAQAWLAAVTPDVPPSLAERMRAAVDDVPDARGMDTPAILAAAAVNCLRAAAADCDSRDSAIHLLAADALMTSACEAAARADGDAAARLRELCASYDVARLAALAGTGEGP